MIACLIVPYFPAAVERRDSDRLAQVDHSVGNKSKPGLIIGGQPWEPQPVYSYSWEVARQGVKPGMSLRLAHFLSPQAHFLPADPPRYVSAAGEIGDILTGFTHLLEPESLWSQGEGKNYFGRRLPARYTLDLESLPAVEAFGLSQEMGRVIRRETHLGPAIGLGENKFVAQIAASLTRSNHARPVAREDEADFLASQSIHFLPLGKETRRRLNLLGIRTLGQLSALPRASLISHLNLDDKQGKLFAQLGQIVKGEMDPALAWWVAFDSPLLSLEPQPSDKKEERLAFHFDPPVANSRTLERVLEQGAAELAGRLQKQKQESRRLDLILESCEGEYDNVYTKLMRRSSTANPQQLLDSLRELLSHAKEKSARLGQDSYTAGFSALTLILQDLNPARAGQLSLFDPPKSGTPLREIVGRLNAKYRIKPAGAKPGDANFGGETFFYPAPADLDHPLLERRFRLDPFCRGLLVAA